MTTSVSLGIVTFAIIAVIIIIIVLSLMNKAKKKKFENKIEELEKEKNLIASTPIMSELQKVEEIIKTEKMEERYKNWEERFENIKKDDVTKITDMIVDLDVISSFDKKEAKIKIAKTELQIYTAKVKADNILKEIKDITVSEEKYRGIVTKLKKKYRSLEQEFNDNKKDYEDSSEAIELQFENIEKRFLSFEKAMEDNEYSEVVHIVKALDTMVDHIAIVVKETPNIMLMLNHLIPQRMNEITKINNDLIKQGYCLDYLKIDYNIEETKKRTNKILDKVKVLNLEDCMFELKTILDYLDSIFNEFTKEKVARKEYEDTTKIFKNKLNRVNDVVKDIYNQMDDIKKMYDLTDNDIKHLDEVNKRLLEINVKYKKLLDAIKKQKEAYSKAEKEVSLLALNLKTLEEDLDLSLKTLGSMYDDEVRAREQLEEIQELLKECKKVIRSYKLPIISNNYFIELAEANEAIGEIIKELEKKPITIKTLNIRVDTARDLVLKLYNTTNEMIKNARLAEISIVYGNRYRYDYEEIDRGLNSAQMLFYKGKYKQALDTAMNTISFIEPSIERKVYDLYEEK